MQEVTEGMLHLITANFSPRTLRIARELRGLTLTALAARCGVTTSAISQYESGKLRPSSDLVRRFSDELGVAPSFFANSQAITAASAAHFRSLKSLSARNRKSVLAFGETLARVLTGVHRWYPETQLQEMQLQPPIAVAAELRSAWNLSTGPVPDLILTLERHGVIVAPISIEDTRVSAFSMWIAGLPFVFLNYAGTSASRLRFTAAHELGHLILHRENIDSSRNVEQEANSFAGEFLLPRDQFSTEFPTRVNFDALFALKAAWNVSVAALLYRARELSLISDATYRFWVTRLTKHGWRRNEPQEIATEQPFAYCKMRSCLLSEMQQGNSAADAFRREDLLALLGGDVAALSNNIPMPATPAAVPSQMLLQI